MIRHHYTYFVFSIFMLFVWHVLFWHRKDLRRQMLVISVLMAVSTVFSQYFFWTRDWWHAETITNTWIGFEHFIGGFAQGGIAAVLFPEIFKEQPNKVTLPHKYLWIFFVLIWNLLIGLFHWIFNINSAIATDIVFGIFGLVVVFERRDLFVDALITGLFMLLLFIGTWHTLRYLSPGWLEKTWFFNQLTGYQLTGIPIEDLVYFFLYGFFIGPLYEFIRGQGWKKYFS